MRHIFIICSLFIITACSTHTDKIISKEIMIDVLVDIHITDAVMKIYNLDHAQTQVSQSHYDSIYARYGINDSLFKWNIAFYTYNQELDDMMETVVTRLHKRQSNAQANRREAIDNAIEKNKKNQAVQETNENGDN